MIALNSTSISISDPNGIMPLQSVEPFDVAIGNDYDLLIDYEFSESVDNVSFWFVPGLFLGAKTPFASTPAKPSAFYSFSVNALDADNTYFDASYSGPSTQQNYGVQWQVSADRLTLTVKLSFYAVADTKDWFRNFASDNSVKLLNSAIDNPTALDNSGESVYSTSKYLGTYLYLELKEDEENIHSYTSNGTTATITRNDGGSFIVDGLSNGLTNVNAYIRRGPLYQDIATGSTISAISHTQVSFTGGTIAPSTTDNCAYFNISDGTNTSFDGSASYGGASNAKYAFNSFSEVEGSFYDEGLTSSPLYYLERASEQVFDLSSEIDTLFVATVASASLPTNCKFLLIRVDGIQNASDFVSDYLLLGFVGSPPTLNGGLYESDFTIPFSQISKQGTYRVISIFYDSANEMVGSHISEVLDVKQVPETLAVPDISSSFTNYIGEYAADSIEEASVYERVLLKLIIDKTSYQSNNVQEGDFDSNIKSVKIAYDGEEVIATKTGGVWATSGLIIDDQSNTLSVSYLIRIKTIWESQSIDFDWSIAFSTEPTLITYKQMVNVRQLEQNTTPDTLLSIVLKDPDTDQVLTNFYLYNKERLKVEVTANSSYSDIAAIVDDGGVFEENLNAGELPALDQSIIADLTALSPNGGFSVKFNDLSADGVIGLVAWAGYDLVLSTAQQEIEIYFGGDPSLQVFMEFEGVSVAVTTNSWFSYDFGSTTLRTLSFRTNNASLLTDVRISRQNGLGNSFVGELDLSKLISLSNIEAQNNQFDSVLFGTFVQQSGVLVELYKNMLNVNSTLQQLDSDNEGASNSNRIFSIYGNSQSDEQTIPLVQTLEALGFSIEIAVFNLQTQ